MSGNQLCEIRLLPREGLKLINVNIFMWSKKQFLSCVIVTNRIGGFRNYPFFFTITSTQVVVAAFLIGVAAFLKAIAAFLIGIATFLKAIAAFLIRVATLKGGLPLPRV
jgi:hypothetical protein